MATERSRNAVILGAVILVAVLILGGLAMLGLKIRAHAAQRRAMEELKAANPVEYYILHTPPAKNADDVKSAMVGKWEIAALRNRQTGDFNFIPGHVGYFKIWTLTNWTVVNYDSSSNVQSSASGHYSVEGEIYTESIETATGPMTQYLGKHPKFRIRVDGDGYYQMSAGQNANPLEEMWRRVQ